MSSSRARGLKCPSFCPIVIKLEFSQQVFGTVLTYEISWKHVQWRPSRSMRACTHTRSNSRFSQKLRKATKIFSEKRLKIKYNKFSVCAKQSRVLFTPIFTFTTCFGRPTVIMPSLHDPAQGDTQCELYFCYIHVSGPCSVVSTATGYGLDGPGIESRWQRDFLHLSRPALGPTQPPVQ